MADQLPMLQYPTHLGPVPVAPLTEREEQLLAAFRPLVADLVSKDPEHRERELAFCDDECLVRYVRSVKHLSAEAAAKRLRATLEWRREFRPDLLDPDDVSHEATNGKMYVHGFDSEGRPIIHMLPRNETTKTYDRQLRYTVFCLELAVKAMPPGVSKICLLMDFVGMTMSKQPPMSVSKKVLDILQNHYVERLGLALVYEAPTIFSIFWRAISPFLDPATRAKIQFVNKGSEVLRQSIPAELNEIQYGGTNTYTYQHEPYWIEARKLWSRETSKAVSTEHANGAANGTEKH
ncbi:CRAL-TRIO domain-containing protein [Hyaloraphidium curvatum]|nr:CRAL-TRIO domain-containing protein [Hyaloraphidium curvatum]